MRAKGSMIVVRVERSATRCVVWVMQVSTSKVGGLFVVVMAGEVVVLSSIRL